MSSVRRSILAGLLALIAIHAPAQVVAQGPAVAQPPAPDAEAAYQEQIRRALQEYDLGHYDEAKAFFAEAHKLQPSARTLRGLALACYELRDYVATIGYASAALASSERPLTQDLRGKLQTILEQSQRFVSHLRLSVEPSAAEVLIDGKPAVRDTDGRILLNPGSHELVAQAAGFESAARTLQAQSGDAIDLRVELRSSVAPSAVAASAAPQAPSDQATGARGSLAPWIVVGASGAVAVTGVVLVALALSDVSSVENARKGTNWSEVKSANDRAPTLSTVGFVMIGVGVAGVAGGLAWKFWPRSPERAANASGAATSAALHVVPGGVRLAGSF